MSTVVDGMSLPAAPPVKLSRTRLKRLSVAVYVGAAIGIIGGIGLIVVPASAAVGWIAVKLSAGDASSLIVAGATLLLADFTALLAWITRQSIAATQREADIAERALIAATRQADIADQGLKAANAQAAIAEEQVRATNEQARIAQEQLAASWRPLLVEPRPRFTVDVPQDTVSRPCAVEIRFVNVGAGPAFVAKAFLQLGVAGNPVHSVVPKIVAVGESVTLRFILRPNSDGVDLAIGKAIRDGLALTVTVLYADISGERAWRSQGHFVPALRDFEREVTDLEVASISLDFLK